MTDQRTDEQGVWDMWTSPDLFPGSWDDLEDVVSFFDIGTEELKSEVFLGDSEVSRRYPIRGKMRMGDLIGRASGGRVGLRSKHFIFHTAYCCSTLLSNYLQQSPRSVVIKEPAIISQLGMKLRPGSRADLLRLKAIWHTLTRVQADKSMLVIKGNVPSNVIAHLLLREDSSLTGSFILPTLEQAITSILKSEWRVTRVREWCMNLYRWGHHLGHPSPKPDTLSDWQLAASWWCENAVIARRIKAEFPSRFIVVDADDVAERPEQVLRRLAALPYMHDLNDEIDTMLASDVATRYSKRTNEIYCVEERIRENKRLLDIYAKECRCAQEWLADRDSMGSIAITR